LRYCLSVLEKQDLDIFIASHFLRNEASQKLIISLSNFERLFLKNIYSNSQNLRGGKKHKKRGTIFQLSEENNVLD